MQAPDSVAKNRVPSDNGGRTGQRYAYLWPFARAAAASLDLVELGRVPADRAAGISAMHYLGQSAAQRIAHAIRQKTDLNVTGMELDYFCLRNNWNSSIEYMWRPSG